MKTINFIVLVILLTFVIPIAPIQVQASNSLNSSWHFSGILEINGDAQLRKFVNSHNFEGGETPENPYRIFLKVGRLILTNITSSIIVDNSTIGHLSNRGKVALELKNASNIEIRGSRIYGSVEIIHSSHTHLTADEINGIYFKIRYSRDIALYPSSSSLKFLRVEFSSGITVINLKISNSQFQGPVLKVEHTCNFALKHFQVTGKIVGEGVKNFTLLQGKIIYSYNSAAISIGLSGDRCENVKLIKLHITGSGIEVDNVINAEIENSIIEMKEYPHREDGVALLNFRNATLENSRIAGYFSRGIYACDGDGLVLLNNSIDVYPWKTRSSTIIPIFLFQVKDAKILENIIAGNLNTPVITLEKSYKVIISDNWIKSQGSRELLKMDDSRAIVMGTNHGPIQPPHRKLTKLIVIILFLVPLLHPRIKMN